MLCFQATGVRKMEEKMIYTFSRRKELNKQLREELSGYRYEEDRQGVPRMRMDRIPAGAEQPMDTHALELMAYRYWEAHRRPMPVFLDMGEGFVEVNYVFHRSDKSLEEADKYIRKRILFVLPSLI